MKKSKKAVRTGEEINLRDLAGGIREIQEFTKEQTLLYANIFKDNPKTPIEITQKKIIEEKIKGYYWMLSHIPSEKRSIATDSTISGIIQGMEQVLQIPMEFIQAAEVIEKVDKEEKDKSGK